MARVSGSWLDGPGGGVSAADAGSYAGERLGLPANGARSVAGLGPRLGALCIDWLLAVVITSLFTGHRPFTPGSNSPWVLVVFAAEYIVLVSLIGCTIGMRLCRIGLMRLDGHRLGFAWVVVRTALLVLVVPAVIYDRDRRGLHDKAAGSVVVRL